MNKPGLIPDASPTDLSLFARYFINYHPIKTPWFSSYQYTNESKIHVPYKDAKWEITNYGRFVQLTLVELIRIINVLFDKRTCPKLLVN